MSPDPTHLTHAEFLPRFLEVQDDLRAFIGALVRDPSLREDVFQEVAMTLWRTFERYDRSRAFGAWARGVAAFKIMENRRARGRWPESYPPEVIEAVVKGFDAPSVHGDDSEPTHRSRALQGCLKALPARSAQIIGERYGRDRPVAEMAAAHGLSLDALYQSLSRIRTQLRECVSRKLSAATPT
jgi:RNA polymerase sigma-70 factor, ECF subfamily